MSSLIVPDEGDLRKALFALNLI